MDEKYNSLSSAVLSSCSLIQDDLEVACGLHLAHCMGYRLQKRTQFIGSCNYILAIEGKNPYIRNDSVMIP